MPRRRSASVDDEQIRSLALRFASEITRVVRSGIAAEVSAQVGRVLQGIARGAGGAGPAALKLPSAATGDRRIGKPPVPVTCPVPGCRTLGVRAKRNFCLEHAASVTEAEKNRLRESQLSGRARGDGNPAATAQASPARRRRGGGGGKATGGKAGARGKSRSRGGGA